MYVRDARNRDEAWLLDHIEAMDLDETAFRSRDYVIAVDEESNTRAGFGRIRIHKSGTDEYCELTSLGVLTGWREQGVGAHIIERLVENASDHEFDSVYAFVEAPGYLEQFGFERIDDDDLPEALQARVIEKRDQISPDAMSMRLACESFVMPPHLRDAFKVASEDAQESDEPVESPEDFGIDPDTATYKYDTGR